MITCKRVEFTKRAVEGENPGCFFSLSMPSKKVHSNYAESGQARGVTAVVRGGAFSDAELNADWLWFICCQMCMRARPGFGMRPFKLSVGQNRASLCYSLGDV